MPTPQLSLDLQGRPSAGEVLVRIRSESRDQSEKGRWFEQLFMRIALQEPEFEVAEIWRWPDWPDREALTGLDGRDIGIDLVAKRTTGEWIAIQCKCYDERHILAESGDRQVPGRVPERDLPTPVGRRHLPMGTECTTSDSQRVTPGHAGRFQPVPRSPGRRRDRRAADSTAVAAAGRRHRGHGRRAG